MGDRLSIETASRRESGLAGPLWREGQTHPTPNAFWREVFCRTCHELDRKLARLLDDKFGVQGSARFDCLQNVDHIPRSHAKGIQAGDDFAQ